ncbi:hypothetical protein ACOJCM_14695 [Billgrantia sp. LNSP4103-1]|uniref:hypothetical protein n=1 Tax=Billgrantia sp. LNSP4103-1 TaxID=3410266 RepID=UPI00403F7851
MRNNDTTTHDFDSLAAQAREFSERLQGCHGLLMSLADCGQTLYLGVQGSDVFAVKMLASRVREYAELWQAAAKHIRTPHISLAEAGISSRVAVYAAAGLSDSVSDRTELGGLFEVHAGYLDPLLCSFRSVLENYSNADRGTDESRTFEAGTIIEQELGRLSFDMEQMQERLYSAWNAIGGQGREEAA